MNEVLSHTEIKEIELSILQDVAMFCEKNGLHYSLIFGTLLGAIRHDGFIPWDDDIDIAIPREEYEWFVKNYTHERFKVIDASVDSRYPYAFGKVIDTRTILKEEASVCYELGVYIDIFPIDGLPRKEKAEKHLKKCRMASRIAIYKMISLKYPIDMIHKLFHICVKFLLMFVSQKRIVRYQEKLAKQYEIKDSEEVGLLTIRLGCCNKFPKSFFYNLTKHKFENGEYNIPMEYDKILNTLYGDYMTPPPEDKRFAHFFEAYWK